METKHTKGKWFAKGHSNLVAANNGESSEWQMKNVCQTYGEDKEEAEANAKLIAAAPDMRETLELIDKEFTNLARQGLQLIELHDKVKAAIKKATE